jgi:hypothetical protein
MAASRGDKKPAVTFEHADDLAYLHDAYALNMRICFPDSDATDARRDRQAHGDVSSLKE